MLILISLDANGLSTLHHALSKTPDLHRHNLPINIELCKLLLLHRANAAVLDQCTDSRIKSQLKVYHAELIKNNTTRLPTLCVLVVTIFQWSVVMVQKTVYPAILACCVGAGAKRTMVSVAFDDVTSLERRWIILFNLLEL